MFRFIEKSIFAFLLFFSLTNFSYSADSDNGSALIIIDMQLYFVTRGGADKDPENVKKVQAILKEQLEAIKQARILKLPIVFIEYKSYGESNADLKKATDGYEDVKTFVKDTDGMFEIYNSTKEQIRKYLSDKKVKTLIITGANGGACVLESINGSLENNYNVIAVSKAIADFNFKDFIYPYQKKYDFKPTCKDCSFKEVDDVDTVAVELATKQLSSKKDTSLNQEDSKREAKPTSPTPSGELGHRSESATATK